MKKMSNAIAREYFLHARDEDADTGEPTCFFSQTGDDDGWGFWVDIDGTVIVDDVSSTGEMPSSRIVDACVTAAVKYLKRKRENAHG